MANLPLDDFNQVAAALALAAERLEINNCEGSEAEHLEIIKAASERMDTARSYLASPGLIEEARDQYGTDECEIDDEGVSTSPSDEGVWVGAWVWIARDDEDEEDEEEY